jgi:cell division protein ZapA
VSEAVPVSIKILDKEYMVSCPPEEQEALLEAAQLLSNRMRQVRDSGKVLGTERMAVMTALNVIHELTRQHRQRMKELEQTGEALQRLEKKVAQATPRREVRESVD